MGDLDRVWDNLLKISQGDVSLYERATSSFEQTAGFSGAPEKTNTSDSQQGYDKRRSDANRG
jgi:hypothetical protein